MNYRVDENNNLIDEEGNIIGGVGSDAKPVVISEQLGEVGEPIVTEDNEVEE